MQGFLTVLGGVTAAWFAVGLACGAVYVATRLGLFFSAGFRWKAMLATVLLTAPAWPLTAYRMFRGDRRDEERFERDRANRSRQLSRSIRLEHSRGEWYRAVTGVHHKALVDAFGRPVDPSVSPDLEGYDIEAITEADHPCKNGEWAEGACPLCGAPERGNSVCGMEKAEFIDVPNYLPEARPMRNAPAEGDILVVANDGPMNGSFLDLSRDTYTVAGFVETAPGKGHWVDSEGHEVVRPHGWWRLPRSRRTQSADDDEMPESWIGDDVPPEAPWKVARRESLAALKAEIARGNAC